MLIFATQCLWRSLWGSTLKTAVENTIHIFSESTSGLPIPQLRPSPKNPFFHLLPWSPDYNSNSSSDTWNSCCSKMFSTIFLQVESRRTRFAENYHLCASHHFMKTTANGNCTGNILQVSILFLSENLSWKRSHCMLTILLCYYERVPLKTLNLRAFCLLVNLVTLNGSIATVCVRVCVCARTSLHLCSHDNCLDIRMSRCRHPSPCPRPHVQKRQQLLSD